jgi:hypothetical protein
MMIRFRDLEVPVAVGLLVLSAFLGITGWNRQPSNGKEIIGGQTVNMPIDPFVYELGKACEEENNCTETKACGAWNAPAFPGDVRPDRCGSPNAYQWEPVQGAPTTNCKLSNQNVCYRYLNETYLPGICATSTWKCKWEEEMIGGQLVGICKPVRQLPAAEFWAVNCHSLYVFGIE